MSSWFKDYPYTPNNETLQKAVIGRLEYGQWKTNERLRETELLRVAGKEEIGELTRRDLWMVGLGIWLGEGSKTTEQIRLTNSDPEIIKLWLRWLREICELDDNNIVVHMHLYHDLDEYVCQAYWQRITKLPVSSFRKTQYDTRVVKNTLKRGGLPYGTLHILVVSNGDKNRGVRLYRIMKGWVSGILS